MTTQHLNHFGVVQGLMQINHRLDHAGHASVGRQNLRSTTERPLPCDALTAWIGRAKDHSGERFGLPNRIVPSQAQCPTGTFNGLTLLCPYHDGFEDGRQISIDRSPMTAGLNGFPFILQSPQIRPQRFG